MTEETQDVAAFFEGHEQQLLLAAQAGVHRAHLAHYEAAGDEATDERVRALLEVVIRCCRAHRLDAAVS